MCYIKRKITKEKICRNKKKKENLNETKMSKQKG